MGIKKDTFFLWICVLTLIVIGVGLGGIIRGEAIHKVVSFVANFSAIIGFCLAIKAYFHWRHKDTVSIQTQIFRDILMTLAEIDLHIHRVLRQAYILERKNDVVEFPSDDQRKIFNDIEESVYQIQRSMIKYYAIEPKPNKHQKTASKYDLVLLAFDDDCFANLKSYLTNIQRLGLYLRSNNKLISSNGKIYSTLPEKIDRDIGERFGGAKDFRELYLFISSNSNELEIELRKYIL